MTEQHDGVKWTAHAVIRKYDEQATARARAAGIDNPTDEDFTRLGIDPYETAEVENNLLTTAGIARLASLITAGGGTAVTSTTARVGVGDGAGTAAVGDTDLGALAGSTHRWFQTCTVTTPSGVITLVAAFGGSDGNFAWNEWAVDVDTATRTSGNTVGALLLNHKTGFGQGTKTAGQTWTFTGTITLS